MEQRWAGDGFVVVREWRAPQHEGPRKASHANLLELCLIEEGQDVFELDGRVRRADAGSYGLVPPTAEHSSWTERKPVEQLVVHLPTGTLDEIARNAGLRFSAESASMSTLRTPVELSAMSRMLRSYLADARADGPLLSSLMYHLATWVVHRHASAAGIDPVIEEVDHPRDRLRAVEAQMRAQPSERRTLGEWAAAAGMSRFHFARAFKQEFGLPPHAHQLRLRLAAAEVLLRTSELSCAAIAYELGFSSASRLTEAFARLYGCTPQRWRAQHS